MAATVPVVSLFVAVPAFAQMWAVQWQALDATSPPAAPVVLDIHHCWINEEQYIDPFDERVTPNIDSWRGVRPVMH